MFQMKFVVVVRSGLVAGVHVPNKKINFFGGGVSISVPKMKMRIRNWKNSRKSIFGIKYEIVSLYGAQCSRVY